MNSIDRRRILLAGTAIAPTTTLGAGVRTAAAQGQSPIAPTQKPNILFILVDNLGYGELGVYGGGATRGASTPRIDKLASEGLRLTNMNMVAKRLPAGSTGTGAIFTDAVKMTHIIRKVLLRQIAILNYVDPF